MKFSISLNYPNLFNPITTITFTLPIKSNVTLEVFDSSEQKVIQLFSEEMLPGRYLQQWNTKGLVSSTYFFRL
jgi:hypothetical protein